MSVCPLLSAQVSGSLSVLPLSLSVILVPLLPSSWTHPLRSLMYVLKGSYPWWRLVVNALQTEKIIFYYESHSLLPLLIFKK